MSEYINGTGDEEMTIEIPKFDSDTYQALKDVLKIQGLEGNYGLNEYMRGMYNGMELMMAILEDRDPVFKKVKEEE